MMHNYEWHPAHELYDVEADPYCMNDLAEDPDYAGVVERLAKKLAAWMKECGDRGQETEMEALEHKPQGAAGKNK